MNIFHYTTVKPKDAGPQTSKTNVRWLITKEMGAKNFAMRLFEMQPGGYSPLHTHDWEHEVFVLEGEGVAVSENKEFSFKTGDVVFIPSNELHQLKNTGNKTCKIICLIPYKEN